MRPLIDFFARIWGALVTYQENALRREDLDDASVYSALEGPLQATLLKHVHDLNGLK